MTNPPDMSGFARGLRRVVALLCSSADEQLAYLRNLGPGDLADELALEFDDMYQVVPALREEGLISREAEQALGEIDAALTQMSELGGEIWLQASLLTARQWREVRDMAQAALPLLPA